MYYYVISIYQGNYSIEGKYRTRGAAEKRADKVQGGETHVFKSLSPDPKVVLQEFRDEQVRRL